MTQENELKKIIEEKESIINYLTAYNEYQVEGREVKRLRPEPIGNCKNIHRLPELKHKTEIDRINKRIENINHQIQFNQDLIKNQFEVKNNNIPPDVYNVQNSENLNVYNYDRYSRDLKIILEYLHPYVDFYTYNNLPITFNDVEYSRENQLLSDNRKKKAFKTTWENEYEQFQVGGELTRNDEEIKNNLKIKMTDMRLNTDLIVLSSVDIRYSYNAENITLTNIFFKFIPVKLDVETARAAYYPRSIYTEYQLNHQVDSRASIVLDKIKNPKFYELKSEIQDEINKPLGFWEKIKRFFKNIFNK